jgi:phosphoesterase RecJ-like protein
MDYATCSSNFKELLSKFKRVTIISHIRPDGDTVSSALALYNSLKDMGVVSELVCANKPPVKYSFLNGFDRFKSKINYDDSLIVTLDCATLSRVGFNIENKVVVNIDHHISNSNFGELNIVDFEVSTTLVLFKLLKEGFSIDKSIGQALYTGLLSDSQNFTTSLTTNKTFKVAGELLEYGIDIQEISNMVNRYNSLSHVRALGRAIATLELYNDAKIAIMYLTQDDISATGATFEDIDGIIDTAISLATAEVAVLITEFVDFIKVSLRSKNANISKVAALFGGGGHKNAAAFEVKNGKIEQVKSDILKEFKDL